MAIINIEILSFLENRNAIHVIKYDINIYVMYQFELPKLSIVKSDKKKDFNEIAFPNKSCIIAYNKTQISKRSNNLGSFTQRIFFVYPSLSFFKFS